MGGSDKKFIISPKLRQEYFIIKAFFLLLIVLLAFLARWLNANCIVVALGGFYVSLTFFKNPRFIFRYIGSFIGSFLFCAGVLIIESTGLYLNELQKYGYYCGAFPLCVAYNFLFLFALEWLDQRWIRRNHIGYCKLRFVANNKRITNNIVRYAGYFVAFAIIVNIIHVIRTPIFLYHVDRFEYKEMFLKGVWGKLSSVEVYLIPIVLINWNNGRKKESICTLGLYYFYLFLIGERFSGFVNAVFYLSIFLVDRPVKNNKAKKPYKFIFITLLFLIFILLVVTNQYARLYSVNTWDHLFQRIAQQGQLWWGTFDIYCKKGRCINEIVDEAQAFTDPLGEKKGRLYYGIYKIMYLCAPEPIVTSKIARGQNYTESTAATILYYLGPVALLLTAILFAWLFVWLSRNYYKCIMENRIISSVIFARLIFTFRNIQTMSRFNKVANISTFIIVVILLVLAFIRDENIKIYTSSIKYKKGDSCVEP